MTPAKFHEHILPLKDKLYRFAVKLVRDQKEAEDILQDVLMKLWNTKDKLDHIANLDAWCMRVLKNQALDRIRSHQFQTRTREIKADNIAQTRDAFLASEAADSLKHIQLIIEQLPDVQKHIIHLRDIEGCSYDEIAEILDVSLAQVKVYLFRARNTLRSKMIQIETYGT